MADCGATATGCGDCGDRSTATATVVGGDWRLLAAAMMAIELAIAALPVNYGFYFQGRE